jgi:hypothetical protein
MRIGFVISGLFLAATMVVRGQASVDFTSSNLPIIVIDVHGKNIVDDPKITVDMGVINNAPGQRNNIDDPFTDYNGKIGIEFRGSTSQMFDKKPYGFEIQDIDGDGADAALLGMPEEEDWCLIATYNDKSLMRDALAYKMGRDLARYGPRTRFCEVVIKNEPDAQGNPKTTPVYKGIYMLTEKIKRDKFRVDINKLDPDEITGDNLTGGYILKIDKSTGDSGLGFESKVNPPNRSGNQRVTFQYEEPAWDDIVQEQKTYIQKFIGDFEAALNGSDFKDETKGYAKYIDVGSFVDFFIVNELSHNVDGYRLSTFMYKDKDSKGGKLVMGPVWDFNLGFGNADYCDGYKTSGWAYNFNSVCSDDGWLVPFWWSKLLSDPAFKEKLGTRWAALRADKFSTTSLHTYIDSLANVLDDEATARNFKAWPVLSQYVWPNYYVGPTYQSEVNWLKKWVSDRALWLDKNMPKPAGTVTATIPEQETWQFSVSPNPFQDEVTVRYTLARPGAFAWELIDPLGRRLSITETRHDTPGSYEVSLRQTGLGSGIYYVQATSYTSTKRVVRKLVKK